jgi:hypothetical protein
MLSVVSRTPCKLLKSNAVRVMRNLKRFDSRRLHHSILAFNCQLVYRALFAYTFGLPLSRKAPGKSPSRVRVHVGFQLLLDGIDAWLSTLRILTS